MKAIPVLFSLLSATLLPGVASAAAADFGINGSTCEYATLQAALVAAGPGGTVFVQQTSGSGHQMSAETVINQDVTIEGGSSSCQRVSNATAPKAELVGVTTGQRLFRVSPGVRLTLVRLGVVGGMATGPDPGNVPPRGGSIRLFNGAQLGMMYSRVEGGTAEAGGCVFGDDASIVMAGGSSISGCSATPLGIQSPEAVGGGVGMNGGSLYIFDNSFISNNESTHHGGNIHAANGAFILAQGGLENGRAKQDGGGAFVTGGSTLNLYSDASVSGNIAGANGGGVFVRNSELNATSDVIFRANDAGRRGGAIHADGSTIEVSGRGRLWDNAAESSGGAIYAEASDVILRGDAVLEENSAGEDGGGVRAVDGSTVMLMGGSSDHLILLQDNSALRHGGAISAEESEVLASFADFYHNHARTPGSLNYLNYGGAIDAHSASFVRLENSNVHSNWAGSGGGIAIRNSDLVIRSIFQTCTPEAHPGDVEFCSNVTANTAQGNSMSGIHLGGEGGGVLALGDSNADVRTTFFRGNRAVDDSDSDGAGSGFAQVAFGTANGNVLLLNTIFDTNSGGSGAAVSSNAGQMAVRNSTFLNNFRALELAGAAAGSLDRNVFKNAATAALSWPSSTPGSCNAFASSSVPALVGTSNVIGASIYLTDYHPSASSLLVDACAAGPVFDIMGTPRPQNGAFDRGAIELIQ